MNQTTIFLVLLCSIFGLSRGNSLEANCSFPVPISGEDYEITPCNETTSFEIGAKHNITCKLGFKRFGLKFSTCGPDGQWHVNTTCIDVQEKHRELGDAAANGDLVRVRELLQIDYIDVDWIDDKGYRDCWNFVDKPTALLRAAHCCKGNVTEVVAELLNHGADINAEEHYQDSTAFHLAAANGNVETLRLLLDRGAHLYIKDRRGFSALLRAVEGRHKEAVRFLVRQGADVEAKNLFGETALMQAAFKGPYEIVRFLLNHGALVNATDDFGRTALIEASVQENNLPTIRLLLDRGADISAEDNLGLTALRRAAYADRIQNMRCLIYRGADVNHRDSKNITALMDAAFHHRIPTARLLLDQGAEIDAQDISGWTALMFAGASNDSIRFLVERGANVNIVDKNGATPLTWTAFFCNYGGVGTLLGRGADVNAKGNTGRTALSMAASKDCTEVVKLLKRHGALELEESEKQRFHVCS